MTTEEAVKHFGSGIKLANALGIEPQAVYQWGEFPPLDRQCQLHVLTNGGLKASKAALDRAKSFGLQLQTA